MYTKMLKNALEIIYDNGEKLDVPTKFMQNGTIFRILVETGLITVYLKPMMSIVTITDAGSKFINKLQ